LTEVLQHQRSITATAADDDEPTNSIAIPTTNQPHTLTLHFSNRNPLNSQRNDLNLIPTTSLQQLMLRNGHSHLSRAFATNVLQNVAQQGGNNNGENARLAATSQNMYPFAQNDLTQLLSLPESRVQQHFQSNQVMQQQQQQIAIANAVRQLQQQQAQSPVQASYLTQLLHRTALNQQQLLHQHELDRVSNEMQIFQQRNQQTLNGSAVNSFRTVPSGTNASILSHFNRDLRTLPERNYETLYHDRRDPGPMITSNPYQNPYLRNENPIQMMNPTHSVNTLPSFTAPSQQALSDSFNARIDRHPMNVQIRNQNSTGPLSLPALLNQPTMDRRMVSDHQYLLREQIEAFEASEDDVTTRLRGRNKPVALGQVGIRCKHCAHLPVSRRYKGSIYFPSNKMGIYQAAQNMSITHIQCGLCDSMPDHIKQQFVLIMNTRYCAANHGMGRSYWAKSASNLGLVDTERHGIRFLPNLPADAVIVDEELKDILGAGAAPAGAASP
jgi:hypothetical protein